MQRVQFFSPGLLGIAMCENVNAQADAALGRNAIDMITVDYRNWEAYRLAAALLHPP